LTGRALPEGKYTWAWAALPAPRIRANTRINFYMGFWPVEVDRPLLHDPGARAVRDGHNRYGTSMEPLSR
jgi:hypothetical protein